MSRFGFRPACRPNNPANRSAIKRRLQVEIKRESHRNSRLIEAHEACSSRSKTNRARRTCATGAERLRCMAINSLRSAASRFISMHLRPGAISLVNVPVAVVGLAQVHCIDDEGNTGKRDAIPGMRGHYSFPRCTSRTLRWSSPRDQDGGDERRNAMKALF